MRASAFEYVVADVPGRKATSNCVGDEARVEFLERGPACDHAEAFVVRVEDLADDTDSLSTAALGDRDCVANRRAGRVQEPGGYDDLVWAGEPVAADEVVTRPSRRATERRDGDLNLREPATATVSSASATTCAVPGWTSTAVRIARCATAGDGCEPGGFCPGTATTAGPAPPEPGIAICTGSVLSWLIPSTTSFSDEFSPSANVIADAPSNTAASVSSVRAGRANGAASPIVIGRGSGTRPSSRCAP